jgi:hypothetical protein
MTQYYEYSNEIIGRCPKCKVRFVWDKRGNDGGPDKIEDALCPRCKSTLQLAESYWSKEGPTIYQIPLTIGWESTVKKAKKDTVEALLEIGLNDIIAKRLAEERVESMGLFRICTSTCPLGKKSPYSCLSCIYGHTDTCHYPKTCEENNCNLSQANVLEDRDYIQLFSEN